MLFTLFVAFFMGFATHQFRSSFNYLVAPLLEFEIILTAVGIAACWTGTVAILLHMRRGETRGRLAPGELICLAEGLCFILLLCLGGLVSFGLDPKEPLPDWGFETQAVLAWIYFLLTLPLSITYLVWGCVQGNILWRIAALSKALAHFVAPVAVAIMVSDIYVSDIIYDLLPWLIVLSYLGSTAIVLIAAYVSSRQQQFRWAHSLGIGAFALIYLTRIAIEIRLFLDPGE